MLELELTAGAGNDEDVDDDSLMMALGEDDSLFGSEAPDGQQAAPLCSTPIKKARLVRGESLTDFLSQELDDGLAPTASPTATSEPHSQPISESSNGVNTTKSSEEGCSEAVSTQQEDSSSDTAPVEPTEATAAGDEDEDEAWESQAEPEGDANDGGNESDDMVMEDEGEQEGESADGDDAGSSSGPGGSNGDNDDGDSDGDDAGGNGDSDNDAGVSDDEMGGGDDVEMRETEDDAADEAEQTVDGSEDNTQCVCVTLTENGESFYCFGAPSLAVGDREPGEDGEGEGEGGEAREELVVFQDRPELYSSPLSAFMQALQEELSMANDIVLEFQGLSLKFYTNLPFVEVRCHSLLLKYFNLASWLRCVC